MPLRLSPAERIAGARRLYADRGGARTTGETAYLAYVFVLVVAMIVIPLAIALAGVLSMPEVLRALRSTASERVVLAACGALVAAASAIGTHRGPAHLPSVLVEALAGTDLPRARTLLRPFVTASLGVIVLFAGAAGLLATVLVASDDTEVDRAVIFTGAAACLGIITATAWLAGQRIGERRGWQLTVALLAATLLSVLLPSVATVTPWGVAALLWPPTTSGGLWRLSPLILVTLACVWAVPRLLNRLHGTTLLEQARRWEVVGAAAYTGDFASALDTFRSRPHLGRGWRAVPGAAAPVRYAVRDLVGAARTPLRALTGLGFLTLGGFLTGLAVAGTIVPAWLLVSLGAVATFSALGTLTDGYRHAAESRSAPTLYGYTTGRLFTLHTPLPVMTAAGCAATGAALARLTGWSAAGALEAALLGILLVAVRAFDSARGDLPLALLTPTPSPAGDLSGLMVLAWQADALLLSVGVGVGLSAAASSGGPALTVGIGAFAGAAVVMLTAARLRRR